MIELSESQAANICTLLIDAIHPHHTMGEVVAVINEIKNKVKQSQTE